jgi:uncharacterized protein
VLSDDTHFTTDESSLRALHPQPILRATGKVLRALDKHCRHIMPLSPFCIVATQGLNGANVSPRGDPPEAVPASRYHLTTSSRGAPFGCATVL